MTTMVKTRESTTDALGRQAPLAAVGLVAIALILVIHLQQRVPPVEVPAGLGACVECGTVLSLRRSAHSTPVYFVDVQMTDGSMRTLQVPSLTVSVGDIVQVSGQTLSLRPL